MTWFREIADPQSLGRSRLLGDLFQEKTDHIFERKGNQQVYKSFVCLFQRKPPALTIVPPLRNSWGLIARPFLLRETKRRRCQWMLGLFLLLGGASVRVKLSHSGGWLPEVLKLGNFLWPALKIDMDVSKNRCTPKSCSLIGCTLINHLFGVSRFSETSNMETEIRILFLGGIRFFLGGLGGWVGYICSF